MAKPLNQLARAVESWASTLDQLHDLDLWMSIPEDLRTQVLIDLKEMRNALGHAQNEASANRVSPSGRSRSEGRDDLSSEQEALVRERVAKEAARQALSPETQKAAKLARRKTVKRGRKGRRR